MAPVTTAGVAAQTLAEALAGMTFVQLVRPGRAGGVRVVRQRRCRCRPGAPTFGTPEPSLVLYTLAALARRLGVPFRRGGSLYRVEAARRAGRVRVGEHAAGHRARRRQLRAPRRGLARGRARDRLREVHPRRRPARDDGDVRARASTCPRTARRSTRSARTDPASTSSARRTRSPTSRTPSTARPPPTTRATSSGSRTARSTPRSERTRSGSSASPPTSRRRSTTRSTRSCATSSPAARPSCPTRSRNPLIWARIGPIPRSGRVQTRIRGCRAPRWRIR